MGDGNCGFDSGDGIWHMAPPSTNGSRRAILAPTLLICVGGVGIFCRFFLFLQFSLSDCSLLLLCWGHWIPDRWVCADLVYDFPLGSGKWMYFVLAGTLGNPHCMRDGISDFYWYCMARFFMTSAGTNASLSMHFFLSWSVLVCLSVGSGRPLGPVQKASSAVVKSSQSQVTAVWPATGCDRKSRWSATAVSVLSALHPLRHSLNSYCLSVFLGISSIHKRKGPRSPQIQQILPWKLTQ